MCLAERSNRPAVVDRGSFLSKTGEAGALLRFSPEQGSNGGDAQRRGGLPLIKVSHGLNSSGSHYTQALVCGWFIAGRLSHKCHTNLYTSYLTSEPVRYITNFSSLTLLTCMPTYEPHCTVSVSFTSGDIHADFDNG